MMHAMAQVRTKKKTETHEILAKAASKSDSVSSPKAPSEDINSIIRRGLAGVFDHDFIDNPNGKNALKSIAAREMEEQAIAKARKAEAALEKSVSTEQFSPTWTGSNETLPKRFGNVSRIKREGD